MPIIDSIPKEDKNVPKKRILTNYATHVQDQGRDQQVQAGTKWGQTWTMNGSAGANRDKQGQERTGWGH